MRMKFPPGVTLWKSNKTKSNWREFSFMLHQIQQAINPVVSLEKVIQQWGEISVALAESSRRRKPQLAKYTFS